MPSDPTLLGYARVSTTDQDPDLQHRALREAGCERIWTEHRSGADRGRPEWLALRDHLRPGDTVVVWKLDRFARSLSHLIATLEELTARGVGLRSLTEPIDTTSSTGRLLTHIVGAMAEFERDLTRERTRAGLAAAVARGVKIGRPAVMTPEKVDAARRLLADPASTHAGVARALGVSRASLYRALRPGDGSEPAPAA